MKAYYLNRHLEEKIADYSRIFPVIALLGPRQCGKSTLAKKIISSHEDFIYLDLEKPSDLQKLSDPEVFFGANRKKRVCIDEIQLRPDLFPVLRGIIDEDRVNGRIIILGSASRDLIRQSTETLAGRIGYLELTPFLEVELRNTTGYSIKRHWLNGGYPDSYLQETEEDSVVWRDNFLKTFVERDIIQLGYNIPAATSFRFLTMCAHNQGQLLNSSKLGDSLGVSYHTIRSYLDFMEQAFLLRSLEPFQANVKKRLVKSPKVYVRDSGLLHRLLGIEDYNNLLGHPVFGASWEGHAMENILAVHTDWTPFFYRTATGNEIDLILENGNRRIAVEFKASAAPKLGKGFYIALEELEIEEAMVVALVRESFPIKDNVTVLPLHEAIDRL